MGGQNLVALVDVDFGFVDREVASRLKGRDGRPNDRWPGCRRLTARRSVNGRLSQDARAAEGCRRDRRRYNPTIPTAVIAKTAMEMGKHAYVEKPLTSLNSRGPACCVRPPQRTKVVTQMGNMGHSSEGAALINEWVQAGVIGPVRDGPRLDESPVGSGLRVYRGRVSSHLSPMCLCRLARTEARLAENMGRQGRDGGGGAGMQAGIWQRVDHQNSQQDSRCGHGRQLPRTGPVSNGISSSVRDRTLPTIRSTIRSTGAAGWIGEPAQSEIWRAHLIDHPYWALGLTYPTSVEATFTPFWDGRARISRSLILSRLRSFTSSPRAIAAACQTSHGMTAD
jgi:hypothetical protein